MLNNEERENLKIMQEFALEQFKQAADNGTPGDPAMALNAARTYAAVSTALNSDQQQGKAGLQPIL